MTRKALLSLLLASVIPSGASATTWGNVDAFLTRGNVRDYTQDIGGIIGSGTFSTGRGLGFSGFDLGFHYAHQFSADNGVMKASGVDGFGMPWFQAEIGLPLKIDGFIRGFSWDSLTVSGGGLRYALLNIQDKPGAPQLLVALDGEAFTHPDFGGTHFGLNFCGSVSYGILRPYVGAGVERTRFIVKRAILDPTMIDESFFAWGNRLVVGVTVRAIPFNYIAAAAALRNGRLGGQLGLGIRF